MIRYHSFYPWHTGGDYTHLTTEKDEKMKPLVKLFRLFDLYINNILVLNFWILQNIISSNFDLYTKCENLPDIEKLQEYYQKLIDKYIPGVLEWWKPNTAQNVPKSFPINYKNFSVKTYYFNFNT